jgi:hypothetical protein
MKRKFKIEEESESEPNGQKESQTHKKSSL